MMQNPRIEAVVEGLGKIITAEYHPINEAVKMLGGRIDLITFRDLAFAQLREGEFSSLALENGWTREGAVYIPRGNVLLFSESPLLQDLDAAIEAYENGPEIGERRQAWLSDEEVKRYLGIAELEKKKPVEERKVFIFERENLKRDSGLLEIPFDVPTYKPNINKEEFLSWLLKDQKDEWRRFAKNSETLSTTRREGINLFADRTFDYDGRNYPGAKAYATQLEYNGIGEISFSTMAYFAYPGDSRRVRFVDKV